MRTQLDKLLEAADDHESYIIERVAFRIKLLWKCEARTRGNLCNWVNVAADEVCGECGGRRPW